MKKLNTKLIALWILLMSFMTVNAADVLLRLNPKPSSSISSYTFSTGDILYAVDATTMSGSTSNTVFPAPDNARVQLKECAISLVSTSASAITVWGTSSGATSARTIFQVSVADTKDGTYTLLEDVTTSTHITSNINGNTGANGMNMSKVTGLSIAKGKFVKITFTTSASGGSTQNLNICGFDITPMAPAAPSIVKFIAQGVEATINEAAKTITAELPYGTNLTAITPTVTIGGTATSYSPAGAQNFSGGAVTYTATDGSNPVNYAVTLTASLTASSDKDISGLTIGTYTPIYNSETTTYSQILPKASSLTQTVNFTIPVTANANFTSGNTHDFATPLTITVTAQDASTKVYTLNAVNGIADLAYVTANGSVGANDTKVYPDLLSKGYYVKLVNPTGTDITQFNSSDLVILTEEVASANTLAVAMGGLIGVKPFLNFKAYMYSKSGWPTGAGSNGTSDADAAIVSGYETHPLFAGVTINGVNASVFTTPAAKGLQGVTTPGSGATIANLTSTGNEAVASIIENNAIASAKYMMIGLANDSYAMVNASGLKLVENAISYLLSNSVFEVWTSISKNKINNIAFDGRIIHNTEQLDLQVYNAVGRKIISSNKNIDMSSYANGVYIVKSNEKIMKLMLSK